jgi:DNA-directed RNA polymerase subunit RPC12/RpoP
MTDITDRLARELRHLVRLLEPLEQEGGLAVPGLATLNGARAALESYDESQRVPPWPKCAACEKPVEAIASWPTLYCSDHTPPLSDAPTACPACAAKRLHLASEREQWHPAAGEGKSKEHGAA